MCSLNDRYSQVMAVTDRKLCRRPFLEQIERVCALHPRAVILREKDLAESEYEMLAKDVASVCGIYGVPCIYHIFTDAAMRAGMDAVHLPLWRLRELAGRTELEPFRMIGVSIHSAAEAKEAEGLGAGYLTAGHIYATDCKRGLPPRGLGFLKEVCQAVSIPVYGIGGIRLENAQIKEVLEAGASGVCVMSEMMRI